MAINDTRSCRSTASAVGRTCPGRATIGWVRRPSFYRDRLRQLAERVDAA